MMPWFGVQGSTFRVEKSSASKFVLTLLDEFFPVDIGLLNIF
jgi:hypothetical protein